VDPEEDKDKEMEF
jgi:hypothetical protein